MRHWSLQELVELIELVVVVLHAGLATSFGAWTAFVGGDQSVYTCSATTLSATHVRLPA